MGILPCFLLNSGKQIFQLSHAGHSEEQAGTQPRGFDLSCVWFYSSVYSMTVKCSIACAEMAFKALGTGAV